MRILKYLFLLLLLSLVAASIFIATQKGDFTVERSQISNSPKAAIYNYVNDARNWSEWNSLAVEDTNIKINPSTNFIGKGSGFSWEGIKGTGNLQTISLKENQYISQKMNLNDNSALITMSFKDTIGGTKVTWIAKGEMGFIFKMQSAFNGGASKVFELLFEKSLANLDQKLDGELNTFNITVDGLVNKPKVYYLAQTINSQFSKVNKNSEIVFSKITHFCKENNIRINGKPFVIYHIYDSIKKVTRLSICIPIKDSIHISEGSDILSRTLPAFQGVKTSLVGHYSHTNSALFKTSEYLKSKNLVPDNTFSHLEIYTIGKTEIKNPSKWTTEIFYPIKQKEVIPSPTVYVPSPKPATETEITKSKPIAVPKVVDPTIKAKEKP